MIDLISRKLATLASTNATAALLATTTRAINPNTYSAVGDGAHPSDDQAAFELSISKIGQSLSTVPTGSYDLAIFQTGAMLEPGIYDVGGLTQDGGNVRIVARIPGTVIIRIPAGQYFLTVSDNVNSVQVDGITFIGGKGAFKFLNPNDNVTLMHSFTRCFFYNYTECAISNASTDQPYLRLRDSVFFGATGSPTIGVAWGGYVDQSVIEHCAFLQNAYHIKIGPRLSSTFTIRHNDFISWGGTPTQADIWIVPNVSDANGANSGFGALITENKFGNENQSIAAPRILIANEDSTTGADRATRFPSTVTGGYLSQLMVFGNVFVGTSSNGASVIECRIDEVHGLEWRRNKFAGGAYGSIITWTNRTSGYYTNTNSLFEFNQTDALDGNFPAASFSNITFAQLLDYAGFFPGDPNAVEVWPLGDMLATNLLLNGVSPATRAVVGTATKVNAGDPRGGKDFSLVTCPASLQGLVASIAAPASFVSGGMVFLDLALAKAPTRSVSQVQIAVYNGTVIAMKRIVPLPANTGYFRTPLYLPANAAPSGWQIAVTGLGVVSGTTDQFVTGDWLVSAGGARMGMTRAMARYPLLPRNQTLIGATTTGTFPTGWVATPSNGLAGLTTTLTNTGCDDKGYFVELTLAGTTTAAGRLYLYFESYQRHAAALNQVWQMYAPVRLQSGSLSTATVQTGSDGSSGPISVDLAVSSTSALLAEYTRAFTPTADYTLFGGSDFVLGASGAAYIDPRLRMDFPSGVAVSAVLRIYTPNVRRLA